MVLTSSSSATRTTRPARSTPPRPWQRLRGAAAYLSSTSPSWSSCPARTRALARGEVWPGAANFLLLRVADGPGTVARLRQHGIAVRPAESFPGLTRDHLRVAVRLPAENARLVEALR